MKQLIFSFLLLASFSGYSQTTVMMYRQVHGAVDYIVKKNGKYGAVKNDKTVLETVYDTIILCNKPALVIAKQNQQYTVLAFDEVFAQLLPFGGTFDRFENTDSFPVGERNDTIYYFYSGTNFYRNRVAGIASDPTYDLATDKPAFLLNVDNNLKFQLSSERSTQQVTTSYPCFLLSMNNAPEFSVVNIDSLTTMLPSDPLNYSVEIVRFNNERYQGYNSVERFIRIKKQGYLSSIVSVFFIPHVGTDAYRPETFHNVVQLEVGLNEELWFKFYNRNTDYLQVSINGKQKIGYVNYLSETSLKERNPGKDKPYVEKPFREPLCYCSGINTGLFWWGGK